MIILLKRFFSIRELKQIITHTKGHYGWKNLNQISNIKEAIQEDSKDKSLKHQKNAKGMGVRNKQIHLSNSVTILWCHIRK